MAKPKELLECLCFRRYQLLCTGLFKLPKTLYNTQADKPLAAKAINPKNTQRQMYTFIRLFDTKLFKHQKLPPCSETQQYTGNFSSLNITYRNEANYLVTCLTALNYKSNHLVHVGYKLHLTLSVPVVLLNFPNLGPYFSLDKLKRISLLILNSLLCLINSDFLNTLCPILYVFFKKLGVDN